MVIGDRKTDTIEHFSPLKKLAPAPRQRRSQGSLGHPRPGHHVRLPRLQPRGRSPAAGGIEVHLHARVADPGGQDAGGGRSRAGADERADAPLASVPLDVVVRAAQRHLDLPHLRALRAAAAVPGGRRAGGAGGRRDLGAVRLVLPVRRGRRPRPVADPRIHAVRRRGPARRARGGRGHPRRQPRAPAADPRARAARGAAAGCGALALRAGRRRGVREATTGAQSGRATGKAGSSDPDPGDAEREAVKL